MSKQNHTQNVRELIEQYQRETLEAYRKSIPEQPAAVQNRLDETYPMPDIEKDIAVLAANTAVPDNVQDDMPDNVPDDMPDDVPDDVPEFPYDETDLEGQQVPYPQTPQSPPTAEDPPYTGTLQVFAYTARGAEPLEGARITVTRSGTNGSVLMASTVTDMDGLSPEIILPSVNPALTMQPQVGQPYILYDIRVSLDGFSTVIYENVPVYGNNSVTQPAALIPLLPGESDTVPRVYRSGGPTDL